MPEQLPEQDVKRLLAWCSSKGFSEAQAKYATGHVRDWGYENGRRKADWVRTIQNGMRDGWALKGFTPDTDGPATGSREWFEANGYDYDVHKAQQGGASS